MAICFFISVVASCKFSDVNKEIYYADYDLRTEKGIREINPSEIAKIKEKGLAYLKMVNDNKGIVTFFVMNVPNVNSRPIIVVLYKKDSNSVYHIKEASNQYDTLNTYVCRNGEEFRMYVFLEPVVYADTTIELAAVDKMSIDSLWGYVRIKQRDTINIIQTLLTKGKLPTFMSGSKGGIHNRVLKKPTLIDLVKGFG